MISYTVFLIGLAVLLFFLRKKIGWGSLLLGMFCMCLLLATPLGGPLTEAAQSVEGAVASVVNSLLSVVGVG